MHPVRSMKKVIQSGRTSRGRRGSFRQFDFHSQFDIHSQFDLLGEELQKSEYCHVNYEHLMSEENMKISKMSTHFIFVVNILWFSQSYYIRQMVFFPLNHGLPLCNLI